MANHNRTCEKELTASGKRTESTLEELERLKLLKESQGHEDHDSCGCGHSH